MPDLTSITVMQSGYRVELRIEGDAQILFMDITPDRADEFAAALKVEAKKARDAIKFDAKTQQPKRLF